MALCLFGRERLQNVGVPLGLFRGTKHSGGLHELFITKLQADGEFVGSVGNKCFVVPSHSYIVL